MTALPGETPAEGVALFIAEAPDGVDVVLDGEHDRFGWLLLDDAVSLCTPSVVATGLANAAAWMKRATTA